jgi:exosome complex component RRP43
VLADPAAFEEPLLETNLTVVMDQSGGLLSMAHVGAPLPLGSTFLVDCTRAAESRARTLAGQLYAL